MLKLIAFSKKRSEDLLQELATEDRKRSHNMTYAIAVAHDLLAQIKSSPELLSSAIDMIFCTGEGEIAQTFEFYKNLSNGERARPLVFQNSLHNSTLGALSLSIPNIDSGITISNGDVSFEMALDMALATNSTKPVMIIGTDVYVDKILEIRFETYKEQVEVVNGACAGLFIPHTHPLFDSLPGPVISDITIKKKTHDQKYFPSYFTSYYPANGLEQIVEGLKSNKTFTYFRPNNYQVHINA
jgi:hypothetical protein